MRNAQMFDINTSAMEALKIALGATQNQYVGAYNRALKRTLQKLYKESIFMMRQELSVTEKKVIERRLKSFLLHRNVKGGMSFSDLVLSSAKIWFGLNAIKVHELRGQMKGQKRVKQPRDPVTGRFLKTRKGARGAAFLPKGKGLSATSFPNSFVAERHGVKSIWIRTSQGYIREAKIAVDEPIEQAIQNYIFSNIGPTFWNFFEKDLKGRVKAKVNFDPTTGKRV